MKFTITDNDPSLGVLKNGTRLVRLIIDSDLEEIQEIFQAAVEAHYALTARRDEESKRALEDLFRDIT